MLRAVSSLRAALSTRFDGYWELYATGLGNHASIAKTLAGINRDALALAGRGPAVSTSLVDQRVQALAACDQTVLERVTHEWKPIANLNDNVFDEENDFWAVAWASALRFLNHLTEDTRALSLPDYLRTEISLVVGTPLVLDIEGAIAVVHDPRTTYSDLRRIQLLNTGVIDADAIRRLLGAETAPAAQLERLRVLQGASKHLSGTAAELLETLALEGWPEELDSQAGGGLPLLVDLIVSRGGTSTLVELVERLQASIRRTSTPQYWAPIAYLLLGTEWKPW